jgi:hypothetical protein
MLFPKKPVKVIFADEESPEAHQAWQTITGGKHLWTVVKSFVFPMVATVLVWLLFGWSTPSLDCRFREIPSLLGLWPPNLIYVGQLSGSDFSESDICWLFAVTSTSSAVWLVWLAWRFGYEVVRRDVAFVPGSAKIFLVRLALMQLALVLIVAFGWSTIRVGFYSTFQVYNLTIKAPMAVNAFKVVFVLGPMNYVVLGALIENTLLLLRYLFLACLNFVKSAVAR